MKKGSIWKRAAAWGLTLALLMGDSALVTFAGEIEGDLFEDEVVVESVSEGATLEDVSGQPEVPEEAQEDAAAELIEGGDILLEEVPEEPAVPEIPAEPEVPEEEPLEEAVPEDVVLQDSLPEGEEPVSEEIETEDSLFEEEEDALEEQNLSADGAASYEYYFTSGVFDPYYHNRMVVGEDLWFGHDVYFNGVNDDGDEVDGWTEFTLEVTDENILRPYRDDDGNWHVEALAAGQAQLRFVYEKAEGDSGDGVQTFDVEVRDDYKYFMNPLYPIDDNYLLAGETMTIGFAVRRASFQQDQGWVEEELDNYQVSYDVSEAGRYEEDGSSTKVDWEELVEITTSDDGKSLVIKSTGTPGWIYGEATAEISLEDGTKESCDYDFYVDVQGGYYRLNVEPEGMTKEEFWDVAPGKKVTFTPRLYWITNTGDELLNDVKFALTDWDPNDFSITYGNSETSYTTDSGMVDTDSFQIVKKVPWGTGLNVIAYRPKNQDDPDGEYEEVFGTGIQFYDHDYSAWFDNLRGDNGGWTWMFTDEQYKLSLNTENLDDLKEDVRYEWTIGTYTDEGDDSKFIPSESSSNYFEESEDGHTITLNGELLKDEYGQDSGLGGFQVNLVIYINNVNVSERDLWVELRELEYSVEWPYTDPWDLDIFSGDELGFDKNVRMWIRDASHPDGEEFWIEVQNIETSPELTVEYREEDNGWAVIAGDQSGSFEVNLTYIDPLTGKQAIKSYVVMVREEAWRLDLFYENDNNGIRAGDRKTVTTALNRQWRDEEGAYHFDPVDDYYVEIDTPENQKEAWGQVELRVRDDGKSIEVDASKEKGYRSIENLIKVFVIKNGVPQEETGRILYVNVTREYNVLFPVTLGSVEGFQYYVDLGDELDLNNSELFDLYMERSIVGSEKETIPLIGNEDYRVHLVNKDSNAWDVKEGTEDWLVPVLIRKGDWGTGISLAVEQREVYENGDEEWNEVCRRDYWFDGVCSEGHHFEDVERPATCTEQGTSYRECVDCGFIENNEIRVTSAIDPDAHDWDNGTVTKPATCTEKGVRTFYCRNGCGTMTTEEIPVDPQAHVWDEGKVTTPATCTKPGVKTYTCKLCGKTKTESIPVDPEAHAWDEGKVTTPATCVKPGVKTFTCKNGCGKTKTESIPATGAHSWGSWTETKKATALAEGEETRTCSVCGEKETRKTAKLKATIKLTASNLTMQTKQSTTAFKVTKMTTGDYVASVKSSKTSVVKVSNINKKAGTFKLTAQSKAGTATVTVTLKSGTKKSFKVTVKKAAVTTTKITGINKNETLKKGKTLTLKPVLSPVTSQDKVTFTTSNKKVATVSSKGKIKAVGVGTATITVKAGKKTAKCKVTVPAVPCTKLTGVQSKVSVKVGKTVALKAKAAPADCTDTITYKSSKTSVATVDSKGVITGKKKGTATITVTCGKVTKKCKVTVK